MGWGRVFGMEVTRIPVLVITVPEGLRNGGLGMTGRWVRRESCRRGGGDSGGSEWLVDDSLSPSRAFLEYYQEHLEYACPTEDIYLE